MITKTNRLIAGLLLAGMIVTQAQASWFSDAWHTFSANVKKVKRNGLRTVSNHQYIAAAAIIATLATSVLGWKVYHWWNNSQQTRIQNNFSRAQVEVDQLTNKLIPAPVESQTPVDHQNLDQTPQDHSKYNGWELDIDFDDKQDTFSK